MENQLNESFIATITKSKLPDVITDIAEVGIDKIIDNISILKDIPIIGVIVKLFSTTFSIRDYIFIKKIIYFLRPLNEINQEKREKMFLKLELNEAYNGRAGDKLLLILEKIDDF